MRDPRPGIPTHALVSAVMSADEGRAGIAFILRDRNRNTVYSSSYQIECSSHVEATYKAMLEALYTAGDAGSPKMTVYCDVVEVISQLEQKAAVPPEAISGHLQVRALMHQFEQVKVKVAHSGKHFIAHKLAAGAAQVLEPPQSESPHPTLFSNQS